MLEFRRHFGRLRAPKEIRTKNLAKPCKRIEPRPREHLSAGRNQESEHGAAHATAVFLGSACHTKIDANCGYHISGEFLNTPETEGPGGERDGWGWMDGPVPWIRICRGSAITEMYPSTSWFGFERRLEPVGFFDKLPQYWNGVWMCLCPNVKLKKLNIEESELASVGRFETWPHADSEASCKTEVVETRLGWAGFVLSLQGHANGWISSSKPVQGRGPSQATAKLGPKASSVANPWVIFLPEKERTNLKIRKIFSHAERQDFSQPWFAQDRGYAVPDGGRSDAKSARYQVNVERVNYTTAGAELPFKALKSDLKAGGYVSARSPGQ
ncbi:hypothetical protein DFH08DRAFT_818469 [Mycena albidolilacea]|uniref:Uncharacterized protein n=1 Tax=Mycena albidolilacea TaxID=1033008 RepID=A0AAD7EGJ2_9AGAR|nr:hypothetical protein DFH08DRAFT_818469 [Mycena albidolilacea]